MSGDFRDNAAKNFFTWWRGAIVFTHNWRSSRYIYDVLADIEVIDAESSHELVHKSGNPFPFLAASAIVPGVIKGNLSSSPRLKYRQQMYDVAYPNLWKKLLFVSLKIM